MTLPARNTPEFKISAARTDIILRDPFFASILMDMDPVLDAQRTDSCATDGMVTIFNPDWLAEADVKLVAACMRKMVMHIALSHHLRRGVKRELQRWQVACSQAVAHIMSNDGSQLPRDLTPNPRFSDMVAEEIYEQLKNDDDQNDPDDGQGDGDGQGQQSPQGGAQGQGGDAGNQQGQGQQPPQGGAGAPLDGADMQNQPERQQAQQKNDERVIRAHMAAKSQGHENGHAKELVQAIRERDMDWREMFQQFISDRAETRVSWSRPNRRFLHEDIYLPGRTPDGIACCVLIVDTSLSMSNRELAMIAGQLEAAREGVGITKVVVIQCDTRVVDVTEYQKTDPLPTRMTFKGRGGTYLQPALDEAQKHSPDVIVCGTDGEFKVLKDDPGAPVMWLLTQEETCATYGQHVQLPMKD